MLLASPPGRMPGVKREKAEVYRRTNAAASSSRPGREKGRRERRGGERGAQLLFRMSQRFSLHYGDVDLLFWQSLVLCLGVARRVILETLRETTSGYVSVFIRQWIQSMRQLGLLQNFTPFFMVEMDGPQMTSRARFRAQLVTGSDSGYLQRAFVFAAALEATPVSVCVLPRIGITLVVSRPTRSQDASGF